MKGEGEGGHGGQDNSHWFVCRSPETSNFIGPGYRAVILYLGLESIVPLFVLLFS